MRAHRRSLFVLAALAIAGLLTMAYGGSSGAPIAIVIWGIVAALAIAMAVRAPATQDGVTPSTQQKDSDAIENSARNILESLDEPLLILDMSGRVVFANRASHSLVGGEPGRKHISAVLRTPGVLEAVDAVLAGGEPAEVAFSVLVPVERHYLAHVARTGGERIVLRIRDLTAQRRTDELRADFVANASHELRTPLAALTGFIDTLRGHAKDDASARERFLEIMSVEASRMRRLIDDLLSLTRIELNEHNPPSGEVDAVQLANEAAAALAPLAASDHISLRIQPHEPLPVVADRDELTQVFQNLLHNAIKYGRQGGGVLVKFGRAEAASKRGADGQIFVAIKDEGEGIAREAIPRLTERFYRVDVKRSRERGGTGLGLAIVKHILNRHGGRLQIESTPGEGSTFTVFLPAAQPGTATA